MKREIQVEITNRCPLNCVHCSSQALRCLPQHEEAFDGKLLAFLSALPGEKHIYLTGGDPLHYPHLGVLCAELQKLPGLTIGLFTNGLMAEDGHLRAVSQEEAGQLHTHGIEDCYVSIYGPNAKVHNAITGCDSFALTCESIQNLLAAGIRANAHIVPSKNSISMLRETVEFVKGLGMNSARLLHLIRTGSAVENWAEIGIGAQEQREEIKKLYQSLNDGTFPVSLSGYPRIAPCRPAADAVGCQCGIGVLYIGYDGMIYPCACAKDLTELCVGSIDEPEQAITTLQMRYTAEFYEDCIR